MKINQDEILKTLNRELSIIMQDKQLPQKQKEAIGKLRLQHSEEQKKLMIKYMKKELDVLKDGKYSILT